MCHADGYLSSNIITKIKSPSISWRTKGIAFLGPQCCSHQAQRQTEATQCNGSIRMIGYTRMELSVRLFTFSWEPLSWKA